MMIYLGPSPSYGFSPTILKQHIPPALSWGIQMFKSIELIRELSEELGMPSGFVEEIENCDFSEAYLEENGLTIIMNLGDEGYSKQVCISGLGTEDYLPYKILMYALGFYLSSNDPKLDNVICELSRCYGDFKIEYQLCVYRCRKCNL